MSNSRLTKFAKVLVNYSMQLKKGDLFFITGSEITNPLMKEVYKEALSAGANPIIYASFDEQKEILFKHGTDEQLTYVNPIEQTCFEQSDAFLTIWGNHNNKYLNNIDSSKFSLYSKGRSEITQNYLERMSNGKLKWCGTQYPTYAAAMDADMSLSEYEEFLFNACYLNTDDPIKEWNRIHELQESYVNYLNSKSFIEVKSKDTHLTLNVGGRKWINCDGRINFPDGEIFTGPIEDSVNGYVRFSYPAIYMNKEVEDVELTFKDGKVIEAKAKKGEDFLRKMLETDEGALRVGEFAIGTNYNIEKFTKNILFDEKLGGTIHIAVGASIPSTGGVNKSAIHWDMLCDLKDGGEIYADGELFYKDGKFLI